MNTINNFTLALLAAALLFLGTPAHAQNCYGSDTYRTCTDSNTGSTYSTRRIGESSYTNGYNPSTGNTWNQSTRRIGDSSYTSGTDADGNSWTSNSRKIGNRTYTNGTDSDGNAFSCTTDSYGNTTCY